MHFQGKESTDLFVELPSLLKGLLLIPNSSGSFPRPIEVPTICDLEAVKGRGVSRDRPVWTSLADGRQESYQIATDTRGRGYPKVLTTVPELD